jgi:hypothetical protein
LRRLGAIPIHGDAGEPEAWIGRAKDAQVLLDLVQPRLPRRLGAKHIAEIARYRLAVTERIVRVLRPLPESDRPLFFSVSGLDDLTPDRSGTVSHLSPICSAPAGFGHIGLGVRRCLESSGLDVVWLYLATVYGGGRTFAKRIVGAGNNHIPRIHVADAARSLVHLAGLERSELRNRTFVIADTTPVTQREFLDCAARRMGAPPPRIVPYWRASLAMGSVLAGTLTRDLKANPSALLKTGFHLEYPSYQDGIAAATSGASPSRSVLA